MQKVTLVIVFLCLLPLAVLAQGNRFIRYDCLANSCRDSLLSGTSRLPRRLPSARNSWQADRIYKVPVMLVEFNDRQFSMDNPQDTYDRIFNERGYNLGNGPGCVADYFREQSGGLLNMKFDVVGPIRMDMSSKSSSKEYFGDNLFRNAAMKADSLLNYADYDWDGRGVVAQVVFVYAGYGGNDNPPKAEGSIWPNTGSFVTFNADGTSVGNYTASAELWTSEKLCGIGTICHEFSHCLGLPDIYPTSGSEFSVLDEWDLMDGGNYSDDGWCPPNYTVQEKELLGWFSAKELDETQTVSNLRPLSLGGDAFRVSNTGEPNEYYLLENRQQQGWDYFIPGHGLTIIHVDFNMSAWLANTVNSSPNHHLLDFFHACGNNYNYYESLFGHNNYKVGRNQNLNGSAYPFVSDTLVVDELTDTSVPVAASLFNRNVQGNKFMGKPIKNIQESANGLISFEFYESVAAGIHLIPDNRMTTRPIYNLYGQRQQTPPQHGLYIINGKKYVAR